MWMWITAALIVLRGELKPEIEHQMARDSAAWRHSPSR
jgi:hypothetical protein